MKIGMVAILLAVLFDVVAIKLLYDVTAFQYNGYIHEETEQYKALHGGMR